MTALPQETPKRRHRRKNRQEIRATCPICKKQFDAYIDSKRVKKACSTSCSAQLRWHKPDPEPVSRVHEIILDMPKHDRVHYEEEGCLPILETVARTGWTDEDMDPTPVPTGCPGCWQRSGTACEECPSKPTRAEVAAYRKDHPAPSLYP